VGCVVGRYLSYSRCLLSVSVSYVHVCMCAYCVLCIRASTSTSTKHKKHKHQAQDIQDPGARWIQAAGRAEYNPPSGNYLGLEPRYVICYNGLLLIMLDACVLSFIITYNSIVYSMYSAGRRRRIRIRIRCDASYT
jgi:hypothetical protein